MAEEKMQAVSQEEAAAAAQKLLEEIDRESAYRKPRGLWGKIITVLLVCFTMFQLYITVDISIPAQVQRMVHLGFVIMLAYLLYGFKKDCDRRRIPWYDVALGLGFLAVVGYYAINFEGIIDRSGAFNTVDIIMGAIGILLVIEACRRVVGWPIVIIASVFIVYALVGPWMPGFLAHRGYSLERVISHLFYTTEGVIGMPISVCVRFVFLFILFGAFLEKTGIGEFFIDFANSIAGFAAGGPAKVAVLTSALEGTVSGSSVSNTVTSGSFTIPLMKSLGYKPEFAAAVEAAASTGGQIMPPVMGAAAFLIAETVGVNYMEVAKAAIIPAVLYFTGIWMMVDLEAKKLGLRGLPRDQLPKLGSLMFRRGHLLLPIVIIIGVLSAGYTAEFAALSGIVASVVVPYLRRETRVPFKELCEAFINGARNMISVSCACGVAGMIVGVVTLTGLGLKLGDGLISLSGDMMILTLFFTMITSLILGMGVPTTANYLITSTIAAPIVMKLGVPALAAHMFAFYFGILADITPPVALAAYAGSAIAKSNPFQTGVNATKLAISAFIIPYMFVFNPSMILIEAAPLTVVGIVISSLVGMYSISISMTGWSIGPVNMVGRILFFCAGLLLIKPGMVTDLLGIGLIVLLLGLQYWRKKKTAAAA